jgi:alkanesulfonate monooxygenase SsuD/methylene tetrahydromethanopterin reductase-like flavin-dependent oxidoreductase (luciferase family)
VTVEVGVSVVPNADDVDRIRRVAAAADAGGLDLLGIQDHPYQRRFLDTWALIGVLIGETERLRFFPDVANLPLRTPAMTAKAAASLDVLSGGRFELGLGAGSFWDAIEAMGGPRRSPREALEALDEAIQIIRRAWSGERGLTFEGRHYSVRGYHPGPPPAHDIGIWIGAYKPRMLALTGRKADGWLPSMGYASPETIPELGARIDDAADKAGRDPSAIRRIYNVSGTITDGAASGPLDGPPDHWVASLAQLASEHRFDTFIVSPAAGDEVRQIERLAHEVAPGLREATD